MPNALSGPPPADGWTTADLDALPEDGVRRELLDGVLPVSPCPADIHQIIAMRLMVALEATCPADLQVTQNNQVGITEPALYAAAGIPFFWRVETDGGFTVHTYRLDPVHEAYGAARTFTEVIDVEEPYPITIPLARLRPRHL